MAADPRVEISARPVPQEPMVCGVLLFSAQGPHYVIVPHYESRDVTELRICGLGTPCVSIDHACRLDTCLPTQK